MIPPEAIWRFADDQKRLLRWTYDAAWERGRDAYRPDGDPETEPDQPRDVAEAGVKGAALLALRRLYRYRPPVRPDPVRRAVALAPSYGGVSRMVGELSTVAPAPPPVAAPATAGAVGTDVGTTVAAPADPAATALLDWVDQNAWRLDAGSSVDWAGETNGYAEAADADGRLLEWTTAEDLNVCSDCDELSLMPPLPLAEWPCQPGDGATTCNVGCRCDLVESPIEILPGDTYAPALSADQEALIGRLTDAQASALAAMMPDAQYLD